MNNTQRVVELRGLVDQDDASAWISNLWTKWNNQRQPKLQEWLEVDKYIFATDTKTTSNSKLPWTHSTTTPKLTQIRDNLHSNYLSSLFPNDKWLTWNAYNDNSSSKEKSKTIRSYMENKIREGGYREAASRMLYDYIDKGNAFAMPSFEARYKVTDTDRVADFIGPKAVRISPLDIVFDPTAASFEKTPKIIRSIMSVGQLKKLAEESPKDSGWVEAYVRRHALSEAAQTYTQDEWNKVSMYSVDGFGSLDEYYGSDTVEILEFYGDFHDTYTGEMKSNQMVTVIDRSIVARQTDIKTYGGSAPIYHVGWRLRPDNLWAMGPLDNLVGMQYMVDHYTNMAANALDLKVMSPKKIIGDVEEFEWGPLSEIHLDENGDVQEMAQQFADVATALDFVQQLEMKMELYAGAPREAMGIRTPGEKTAFEVQALENAAGRIFQEKIIQFEIFQEKLLNGMLEEAHRNFPILDVIRVVDDDLGVEYFKDITKEDITADGVLRPVGARHYAQRAQELQNLMGVFNSPMFQLIAPHTSGIGLTEFIKDVVDLRGYDIFGENIQIQEQRDTQALARMSMEDDEMMAQMSEEEMLAQAEQEQMQ